MIFLWKIAAGDPAILKLCGQKSQKTFAVIGMLYLLVSSLIFISFFGLFYSIFDNFIVALLTAVIFTFLIANTCRLILISLEPQTLPIEESKGSLNIAYIIRFFVLTLFALFVSKCFETTLFGSIVNADVEEYMFYELGAVKVRDFDQSSMFVEHLIFLNKNHPWVWVITIMVVSIFYWPYILRHQLKKNKEYYSIKTNIDKTIVGNEYKHFKDVYIERVGDLIFDKRFILKERKYADAPYCIEKRKDNKKYKSNADFISATLPE